MHLQNPLPTGGVSLYYITAQIYSPSIYRNYRGKRCLYWQKLTKTDKFWQKLTNAGQIQSVALECDGLGILKSSPSHLSATDWILVYPVRRTIEAPPPPLHPLCPRCPACIWHAIQQPAVQTSSYTTTLPCPGVSVSCHTDYYCPGSRTPAAGRSARGSAEWSKTERWGSLKSMSSWCSASDWFSFTPDPVQCRKIYPSRNHQCLTRELLGVMKLVAFLYWISTKLKTSKTIVPVFHPSVHDFIFCPYWKSSIIVQEGNIWKKRGQSLEQIGIESQFYESGGNNYFGLTIFFISI